MASVFKGSDTMTHAKITSLSPAMYQSLIGQKLPTHLHGHAGRALESLIESMGWPINRRHGPDILVFGLELKCRETGCTSAQTIADMNINDILVTDYHGSHVKSKFQQQLRVFTKDNIIVDIGIYDFSRPIIQEHIERAYNHARQQLIDAKAQNIDLVRTSYRGGFYGFFERCHAESPNTYSFRLSDNDMEIIENMALSKFHDFYEF
jgi:hypothetical protein